MTQITHPTATIVRTERGLTITGTRLTLYTILDCVHAGWPMVLIRDRFDLTDQQVSAALAYIAEHQADVEAEYQQVLRDAESTRQYWEAHNRERFAAIAALSPSPEQAALRAKLADQRARRRSL